MKHISINLKNLEERLRQSKLESSNKCPNCKTVTRREFCNYCENTSLLLKVSEAYLYDSEL